MQNDRRNLIDTSHALGSDHNGTHSTIQLSANMAHRLEKLVRWRIDPSLIKFSEGDRQSEGGSATVSRALLKSSVDGTEDKHMELNAPGATPSNHISELEGNNESGKAEVNGEREDESEAEGERQTQGSSDKSSGGWKAVAVKKMKVKTTDDSVKILGLTLREAEFLVGLSHENIIKLEGFVEDASKEMIWLVLPWEENGTLKDFIASAKWEIPERIWLIHDVALGVEYLHGTKPPICHGDLKSTNVLVNSNLRAMITDFGSAHHPVTNGVNVGREPAENEPQPEPPIEATFCLSTNTITLTSVQYTTRWAAPELLKGNDSSLASDIWALGWVAYEVMTNYIPFEDVKGEAKVIIRVARGDLPSISNDTRMLLIQALCSLVGQCWKIDPSKRPTADECRKSIQWLPMVIPNPVRTDEAILGGHSAELLMRMGDMHRDQSDYSSAAKYYANALDIFTSIANSKGQANALTELAQIYRAHQEHIQAITSYSDAITIHTNTGDEQGKACALFGLAEVHRARNEYIQAITLYSECLEIRTKTGDGRGRAEALWGLAAVHLLQNEHRQAIELYSESLQLYTDLSNRKGRASALWGLAEVHRTQYDFSQALTFYSECLQIRTDLGDRRGTANALYGLASVHKGQNECSRAVPLYSESLQIRMEIGDQSGRADALWGLAEVHRLLMEYPQAVKFYSEALQIRTDIGDRRGRAEALWGLAEVHRLQQEYSQAMVSFTECLEVYTDIGDRGLRGFTLQCIGDTYRNQDDCNAAIHHYEQAAEIFKEIGNSHHEAIVLKRAADVRQLME